MDLIVFLESVVMSHNCNKSHRKVANLEISMKIKHFNDDI